MCSKSNFEGYIFKKFDLPEVDWVISGLGEKTSIPLVNDSDVASWYFLNRLDIDHCIDGCISFEDISTAFSAKKDNLLTQLMEARKLLRNIQQDIASGQISDAPQDIRDFFEKYSGWVEMNNLLNPIMLKED